MKELKQNDTEVIINEGDTMPKQQEPTEKQIIESLALQVIELNAENQKLIEENKTLNNCLKEEIDTNCKLSKKFDALGKELQDAHREIQCLSDELDCRKANDKGEDKNTCCCEPSPYQGYYKPWDEKMLGLYSHLQGEERFYEERNKHIRHEMIEKHCAAHGMNLKFNKGYLKKIRKLMKIITK